MPVHWWYNDNEEISQFYCCRVLHGLCCGYVPALLLVVPYVSIHVFSLFFSLRELDLTQVSIILLFVMMHSLAIKVTGDMPLTELRTDFQHRRK